ncbi:MAG: nonstructural protein [Microvirus sp.]|nr:MAG: nonstructural protein [Microvirus sp.]
MLLKIFALNDSKLGEFGQPFFFPHHGQAVRLLQDLTKDSKTTIAQHPEDFRLYCLGTYSPASGTFENLQTPEYIAKASDFTNG